MAADLFAMSPDGAVGEAGRKFEGEALVEAGEFALEEPGLFGEVGMAALLVLVGDDAAGVAAGSVGGPDFEVYRRVCPGPG